MNSHVISSESSECFYAFMKDDKFLHQDEWDAYPAAKVIPLLTDDPTEAYTYRNRERALFHLTEYSNRLKGFKIVKVEEKVIKTYTIKDQND